MDEAEGTNTDDAVETDQDCKLRLLRAESLERHRAVTWLNCACSPDTVPNPTFIGVLKCVFVFTLLLSVLSNFLLGPLFEDFPHTSAPWYTLLLSPIETNWKTNVFIVAFVAVVYVGAFLRKLKKTSGSASHRISSQRREEVPTISASIQHV